MASIQTATPITTSSTDSNHPRPGVELRWPASAIWRPGEPAVNAIGLNDLKDALANGLDDFKAMPSHAIFLSVMYPLIGLVLFRLAFGQNTLQLVFPMIAGFALIGPIAALGLYELSRRRERGLDTSASHALDVLKSPSIHAIITLGLVLVAIFFTWMVTAQALYVQQFGSAAPASVASFAEQIFSTDAGRNLIISGNAVGLLFAGVTLVISVISFPMLLDQQVSAATAVRASIRAVLASPFTMAVWGLIVAAALVLGSLPLFLGLAVVLPVLGHATWHLYRKVVSP